MKEKRLSKALADGGIAARRKAEQMIFEGRVRVNGEITLVPQTKVIPGKDKILVDEKIRVREPLKKYFLLHKPKGYTCSSVPKENEKIVLDLFRKEKTRLFTVGRLDKDTTGLLIVTNDGEFANQIIHPSSNIIKTYQLRCANEITPEHINKLKQGAYIDSKKIRPSFIKTTKKHELFIGIKEGKKHEIKILALRAKLKLRDLKRVSIGSLQLGDLPKGSFRILTKSDQKKIFDRPI